MQLNIKTNIHATRYNTRLDTRYNIPNNIITLYKNNINLIQKILRCKYINLLLVTIY